MTHWGVGARLLSCASMLVLAGASAGGAAAHPSWSSCQSITHPTTINHDKRCVTVKKTINGDVVNNAKLGKSPGYYHSHRPGFFIGDGGLIKGKLVNNGGIFGGEKGRGALTLGQDADVRGGIFNNGVIASHHGSGISLGYYEHGWHGVPRAANLTGNIVNSGLIWGDDYGVAARYGTMSGALINTASGVVIGGDVGVYISDSFTSWSGGIDNAGLIFGNTSGIQIGGGHGEWGGDGGEHGAYGHHTVDYDDGVVFSGGISNTGAIVSNAGPSIAIGGASFSGGVYNDGLITQYPGYGGDGYGHHGEHHHSPYKGVGIVFTADTVEGGLFNDVNGKIYGTKGPAVWITDKTESFSSGITNLGTIAGANDGIRIESATFSGGLTNGASGAIVASHGDAIFASSAWSGDFTNHGLISGAQNGFAYAGSTFDGDFGNAGVIEGGNVAVSMSGETFDGAFANTGVIAGGATGVALNFGSIAGGFTNSGTIAGAWGDGVAITVGTWGAADARADIVNSGTITGADTGFLLDAGTVYGDFINDGQITGYGANTGVHVIADAFYGDIVNNKTIDSPYDALVADIGTFDGSFANRGDIAGGANGAVFVLGEMTGNFTNSGSISGEWGNGVDITVDTWGSGIAPVAIANTAGGVIRGGATGFALDAGTVHGTFTNDGLIQGGTTGASIAANTFDAPFANSGDIKGGVDGVVMALGQATGGFSNSGSIAGESGNGVDIVVTSWGTIEARADIVNTPGGVISGGANGLSLDLVTMHGDVANGGLIAGGNIAVLMSGGTFDGAFTNTGDIDGGATGVAFDFETVTGAFTNSGSIDGVNGDGVAITVGTWGAADARADIVNTATGVIAGGDTGFLINAGTVYGDFINDGQISGQGENTGVHIIAGEFVGDIVNNKSISSPYDALVADIDLFDGNFANTDRISGGVNGAVLILGEMTGDATNSGSISGTIGNGLDITVNTWGSTEAPVAIANTVNGVITGGAIGFALHAGEVHGTFTNDGAIQGGTTGASFVVETFDAPFANSGGINGGTNGVVMALGQASGGFSNSGSITGTNGNGVDIVVTAWGSTDARADIVNTAGGSISGGANGLSLELVTMHGDIDNDGAISGGNIAVLVSGGMFDGAFTNTNDIDGGTTGVAFNLETVTGAFTNSGSIDGVSGDGVALTVGTWGAADARADIVNAATGVIAGGDTGFLIDAGAVYGDFINDGQISGQGENTGVRIIADAFVGDVKNNNAIGSPYDALVVEAGLFDGSFANTGSIAGGDSGAVFQLGKMTGDFTNSNSIIGTAVDGVAITVETWGSTIAPVAITNTVDGVMSGGATGFALDAGTLHGAFTNQGSISGGTTGASFTADTFDAPFANSGDISGGANGVVMALGTASGGFSNSGSIAGTSGNGVDILVTTWGSAAARADIVNTATGVITGGDTGFLIEAGTVYGDFINDGQITGSGSDTGLHIIAGTFAGDVVNNNALDAPSNALHLEIGTLNGEVVNTGTITASDANGVAAAFAIGNGATFTNTGGGLIIGDVVFGGKAAYHFIAEDGGIDGNLIGEGGDSNDDTITVRNGTHTFTDGTASNFASFVVEDGATALMGALFEGDGAGSGYAFSNVDNLTVNNGGTLYIDKSTTLVVDNNFTQQAGGTLEFYLGAPGGADFADLTGNVVAGDGDYGQIVVNGTATLDGSVVGFLDPAFADANPGLDQVLYDDVIVATGGISGDFSTVALIADSSLFELNEIIDGNTVDMQVTRTSLNIGDLAGIVVNTGGPFDAMVSDRSNGLGSGSCGLASASDGWCFNRFAANEPGATQVMTDAPPSDPFAWLRTGVRKEGETAVWGRAIGVFGETDGHAGSRGTDFTVGGAIAGIDHNFSPTFMAGLAAQWTATDVDFKGRPDGAEVESFEAGAYMAYGDTRLYLNANASVIWHEVDVNRFTPSGRSFGEYDGTTLSAFAEVGKTFETPEMRIQPFVALSYSHLETNGYSETGTGTRLNVSGSEFDSLKSIVGARLAYPIELESGRKVVPEFRLAWAHEFMDDQASFVATVQGQQPVPTLVRGEKFSRDTVVVGAGVTVPLSDSAAMFVDYDGGLNNDITTHTVSAGIRLTW